MSKIIESVLQTVQKKNNLHIDSTYTVQKTMCKKKKKHTYTQYTQCTIRHTNGAFPLHGTARYGSLLGGFPLGTVPGT